MTCDFFQVAPSCQDMNTGSLVWPCFSARGWFRVSLAWRCREGSRAERVWDLLLQRLEGSWALLCPWAGSSRTLGSGPWGGPGARHRHCCVRGRCWEARLQPSVNTTVTREDMERLVGPAHPDLASGLGPRSCGGSPVTPVRCSPASRALRPIAWAGPGWRSWRLGLAGACARA